jgi:hypothetical protein
VSIPPIRLRAWDTIRTPPEWYRYTVTSHSLAAHRHINDCWTQLGTGT